MTTTFGAVVKHQSTAAKPSGAPDDSCALNGSCGSCGGTTACGGGGALAAAAAAALRELAAASASTLAL